MLVNHTVGRHSFNMAMSRAMTRSWRKGDDRGAALVTVVVVMMVGVAAALLIAAYVTYAIWTNGNNASRTQAFIAAESGRDAVLAKMLLSPCDLTVQQNDPAQPGYDSTLPMYRNASATTGPDSSNQSRACPVAKTKSTIVITSTGFTSAGQPTTVVSTYLRDISTTNSPGGTMSYFDGSFLATQSNYTGDLVIRNGPYACNSHSTINGDLWVLNGTVDLSADCTINGNVYAFGAITASGGNGAIVKGNLYTAGLVDLSANHFALGVATDAASGSVYADGTFTLGNKPSILGSYVVGGAATMNGGAVVGKPATSVAKCATTPTPAANAGLCGTPDLKKPGTDRTTPSLAMVKTMTTWRDLGNVRAPWGSSVEWRTGPCDGSDVRGLLTAAPAAGNTRIGIDYSGCTGTTTIKISGGALSYDAVFLARANGAMSVNVTGNITSANDPQLFFVHADANLTDTGGTPPEPKPSCGSGSASDSLNLPGTVQARMMFYTPCGLNNSSQNGLVFRGQYYSNNDGSAHWVHPDFTCTPMSWAPVIDLGCKVAASVSNPGTPEITELPAVLQSQTETPG